MLWSMFKIVLFVAFVAVAALGAGWLMETGGGVRIAVGALEFNLGALQAVIAFALFVLAVWLLLKIVSLLAAVVHFLNGDETAISRYFDRNRERKGYEALADGLMALASGEERVAMAKAARAEKFLHRPELTNLITAQAAEMAGDRKKAEVVYKRLLQDERTRFVGVRGIMKQRLEEGDTETAMKLAEKAFALKPRHGETGDILLALQATRNDWAGARKTLGAKVKTGALPKDVGKRRDAVLALQEAKDIFEEGNSIRAREAAIEANKLSPDLIPGAVLAAKSYLEQDNPRYATRVLAKAWQVSPHPDLAAAFAAIEPDETPEARLKRFKALTKYQKEHPETRMLLAELHIADNDFSAARKALGDLAETDPTQRALALMAAIERGEGGDDEAVRAWLARAVTASRGPQWVCDKCNQIHADWAPVCSNCGAFDTLSWKVPAEGEGRIHGGAEMLPLLVAKPEPTAPDAPKVEPETVAEPPHADYADPDETVASELAPEVEARHDK
ncbi:heme biosynthesis protein HemY [Maritimibacter sp. HL-12]|uniref:heme biosynthesis protein HemY n=1 Tax=Maritimibacter sp. HL-12 TaxID=1162418 RepID=UPI000A0F1FE4|nr:heme biosynthesis HemY N-terminal domain-containing protein [Maritimibacter sp. HL-12]SMH44422.1 HemY protein [Maritimibacter sp. HL-12]